ncbi:MAG: hypothetical protein OXC07_09030 [Kistimonas sp.]|nr:hypothetical protein [Kistimonas sp.]
MSQAKADAIEAMRETLKTYVMTSVSLVDKVHRAAGGFMDSGETQRVQEKSGDMGKMEEILNILRTKGDREFGVFVALLRQTNNGHWGDELEQKAQAFASARPTSTPEIQGRNETPVAGSREAGVQQRQLQDEVAVLQGQLQSALAHIQSLEASLAGKDRQIAEQQDKIAYQKDEVAMWQEISASAERQGETIATQEVEIQKLEETVAKQDAAMGQLRQTITALEEQAKSHAARQSASTSAAAGPSSTAAGGDPQYRLAEALALLERLQRNPNIDDTKIASVIACARAPLSVDKQLADQFSNVATWLANRNERKFVNAYHLDRWEGSGMTHSRRANDLLSSLGGAFIWGDDFASRQRAVDQFMVLLNAFSGHGCYQATDTIIRLLERVAAGLPAYEGR